MATQARAQVAPRRIVAALYWQRPASRELGAIAELARHLQAELVGLFIEDIDLLHLAALPFAAQIGATSALRHELDAAALEQLMRSRAEELRGALETVAERVAVRWSFRVARGSAAQLLIAASAEENAPTLLLPAGADPGSEPHALVAGELSVARLRPLLEGSRPVLVAAAGL